MTAAAPGAPFAEARWDLDGVTLRAVDPAKAGDLAARLAAIDPWRRLGYSADGLHAYLTRPDPGARRLALVDAERIVGIAVVRHPWLRGPCLELLAVFSEAQGHGLGGVFLDWLSAQAAIADRNLWVTVSEDNARARAFYRRHGFAEAGRLDDLVRDGSCELLLRKRLA